MQTSSITSAETFSRLLGLRVTARLEPDVLGLVLLRINAIIGDLEREQLQDVLWAAVDHAAMMYEEREPSVARRQADNIARALRSAEDAGVA